MTTWNPRANDLFLKALELRSGIGHEWGRALSLASLAEVNLRLGLPETARRDAAEAYDIFDRLGDRQRRDWARGALDQAAARAAP